MNEYIRLDEACVLNMGQSPDSSSYNENGNGLPFFQGNADFGDMYPEVRIWCSSPTKIVDENTLLISVRAPIGALNFSNTKSCIGRGLAGLTPIGEFNLKYIYYCLKSKHSELNAKGTGSTFKAISKNALGETLVRKIDKEKQSEIVEILDKAYDIICKRKQELEQLDLLIKARFVEMFGIPLLNDRNWNVISAGECCSIITDGSHFSPQGQDGGYPMLSVKDMRNDGFHYDSCKKISEEDFQTLKKQGCIPQVNDVLISKDGSYFYYGFVLREYKNQAILSSIAMLRPDLEQVNPYYLCNYMLSERIVGLVSDNYVTGAALKRVILKGIKQIPVMLPPIELQEEFEKFVHQVDKCKLAVQKSLDETQLLFDSLMQQYFG